MPDKKTSSRKNCKDQLALTLWVWGALNLREYHCSMLAIRLHRFAWFITVKNTSKSVNRDELNLGSYQIPESDCYTSFPENRRVRFQCCRDHGDRGMDQLVTVLFTDEFFQRTKEFVSNVAEIMEIKAWINRLHQISYSIFEVGGEAIPVMRLREKRKTQERQICWFLIEDDV
ncbi:hypothetical protein TNCV_812901 [Trichonephila clavipes]|nr:hypothetical protein TNCV_812901 [Trichonephila clavipes]